MMNRYDEFDRRFDAAATRKLMNSTPVVALSGDALTGKSTLATHLARTLGWRQLSGGTFAREACKRRGFDIASAAEVLGEEEDVAVDLGMVRAMACPADGPAIVDGRLAVHMASWLKQLGKPQLLCIYLEAPLAERLIRHIGRCLGESVQGSVQEVVGGISSLEDRVERLRSYRHPQMGDVLSQWEQEQARDGRDQTRLECVYGFNYAQRPPCDVVVDTSTSTPQETSEAVLEAIRLTLL